MKYLILIFFAFPVLGCDKLGDQLNPMLKKKLEAYDKFIISLQNEKDPLKLINKRIKSEGILLEAYINEKLVKNYPTSFVDDSITGARTLFLKNMKLPPGLSNDIIYEVASPDSLKPLRSWQISANHSFLGIRGNEILAREYLGTPCSNFRRDILLAISSKGTFYAVSDMKIPDPKYDIKCPAAKTLFKGSEYGSCVELMDLKTKKKRIIVYQTPMT